MTRHMTEDRMANWTNIRIHLPTQRKLQRLKRLNHLPMTYAIDALVEAELTRLQPKTTPAEPTTPPQAAAA
jgi:hypothetical protein